MNALAGQHVRGHPRLRLTVDDLAPATRLLDKKREMLEVQESLESQKQDFAMREESLRAREDQLAKKNVLLRQSLFKFNKFLHDNDLKRSRAEKKAAEEARIAAQKALELEALKSTMRDLAEKQREMGSIVAASRRYQEFLELVCETSDDHKQSDVEDLLARYETLKAAHEDLVESTHSVEADIERVKHDMQAFIRERSTEILRSNNDLAKLQMEAERAAKRRLAAQLTHENDVQQSLKERGELARVRMAVENLYERVLSVSTIQHKETHNPMVQLRVIKQYVGDLMSMTGTAATIGLRSRVAAAREMQTPATNTNNSGDQTPQNNP